MADKNVTLTVIELFISLVVEGVLLTMIFNWISNKSGEKQQQHLQQEMSNIEIQNKFIFEQLQNDIHKAKTEIISQIKESTKNVI